MIKIFLLYKLFDYCLDLLDSKIEYTMLPKPEGACVQITSCFSGITYIMWNPVVLDSSVGSVTIYCNKVMYYYQEEQNKIIQENFTANFTDYTWNLRKYL